MDLKAFFISPSGSVVPVDAVHINTVIEKPEEFGLNSKYIIDTHKKHKESLGVEGNARNEILSKLLIDGWVRGRFMDREGTVNLQIYQLTQTIKDNIYDFITAVQKGKIKMGKSPKHNFYRIYDIRGNEFVNDDAKGAIKQLFAESKILESFRSKLEKILRTI